MRYANAISHGQHLFFYRCVPSHTLQAHKDSNESTFTPQDGFGIPIPIEKLLKLWFEHTALHEIDNFFSRHQEDTEWVICRKTGLSYYFKTISASSVITTR